MTLQQLSVLKQWHVAHKRQHPIEFHVWDAVLTLWLLGWIGIAPAVLLDQLFGVVACTLLFFVPTWYVRMRRSLHRRGKLRCDWLDQTRGA